ncbi:hypothetical protein FIU97_07805 [Roseivivax sp. THAF40]|uniref:DUF1127 domain-containing protein n=1 Tax=unclassified Roseivivax TaxID=2639302 RepID=UPI0012689487|nr:MULTISPECIES: DUF1127 domain-containing protein [unclassified Roseivivax]QFS82701.1 hypothetical protein FIV09_07700 [Roseivivax sp. THAF197b]QFT46470.1 hypothetical protein FIU97_07805 [Roseivivax sp. THAF40]
MTSTVSHAANLAYLADAPRLGVPATIALKVAVAMTVWSERARTRHHLGQLDDHLLRDIGVSRSSAEAEARRPFWQG